jgi:biopolymer transport protein ExbD
MSVSVDTGGKGGKKPLNAELNLVPYIDLLTCMVAFLLITAVWTQLARLQAQQKAPGAQSSEEIPPEKQLKIAVVVSEVGFNLVVDQEQTPLPKRGADYDFERLGTELRKVKEAHPDKNDLQVASEDQIKFDVLIKTMDTALSAHFADISLVDTGAAGI